MVSLYGVLEVRSDLLRHACYRSEGPSFSESRLLNSCRPLKNKAPPVIEVLGWSIHGLLVMGSWFWGFGFLNKDCAARGLMHHSLPSNLWSIERDHANSVHGMVWYGMVWHGMVWYGRLYACICNYVGR